MKKVLKRFLIAFGTTLAVYAMMVAVLVGFVYYKMTHRYVPLGNGVTWEFRSGYLGGYSSTYSLKKNGKVALTSRGTQLLWGKYPYIWGDSHDGLFIYDVRDGSLAHYGDWKSAGKKYSIDISSSDFVTFEDLNGQWAKAEKLEALRKALKPPDPSESISPQSN